MWDCLAPDVVSVDSSGKVTALSDTGSADITVSTVEGGFEDTCRVTLVNNPKPDPDTKPTPAPSDGGGGCNTGMGALLLLSALPVFFRKKF